MGTARGAFTGPSRALWDIGFGAVCGNPKQLADGVTGYAGFVAGGLATTRRLTNDGLRTTWLAGNAGQLRGRMLGLADGHPVLPSSRMRGRRGLGAGDATRVVRPSRTHSTAFSGMRTTSVDFLNASRRVSGVLYGERRLATLKNYLERHDVDLFVGDEYLLPRQSGGFYIYEDAGRRPAMVLGSNPTRYEVWHELSHYIHYRRIGREAYKNLPRTTKWDAAEQFVYDMLSNNDHRWWHQLNEAARMHANKYIIEEGGLR